FRGTRLNRSSAQALAATGSERSAEICSRVAPCLRQCSVSAGSAVRATVKSMTPGAASACARACPSPREAPVTIATVCGIMGLDPLFQAGLDEGIQVAIKYFLCIGKFDVGAQIFDAALVEHVGADLMSPAHIGL